MGRVLVLLLVALLLAGCGGAGSSGKSSAPSLAAAATKSSKVTSMKIDMTMKTTSSQLSQPLTLSMNGAEDNANRRAELDIDMSALATSLGSLGGGNTQLSNPANWKGKEITDFAHGHADLYMTLPFLTRLVPGHKPWIKLDLNAFGGKLGVNFSQFTRLSSDPGQMLDWLRATSGSITKVGTETVDGVQTTHYHATIDLSKYPNLVPPDQQAAMRKAVDSLTKLSGLSTFPVDAWVGHDGLIRKELITLTENVQGQKGRVDVAVHIYDFGAPVSISLPLAAQTTDLTKLVGQSNP